ncbi:phosphate acetyltransferase [Corynebacterium haemomassiliense]|uniref:Phosphate acetyltransferase n=1 Tax=Corynebacterium haemomassiliense TaxID=2754726 RepID=A0A7W2EBG2_9CORY|nr:phosphate acetyltransferase [Corynebacterium haemomassiliense]MBA5244527.1 phosphate acetyltransferase [Corynebacterium haemomassiliense]
MSQRQSLLVTLANRTFDGLDLQQLASRLELPLVRLSGDSVAEIFNSEQITEEPALYAGTGDYNFDAQLAAALGAPVLLAAGDETAAKLAEARIGELGATVASISNGDFDNVEPVEAQQVMSPVVFERQLIEQARANRKHVVLPEGEDDRILQAADQLLKQGVAELTILGDVDDMNRRAADLGLDLTGANLVNHLESELAEEFAAEFAELRKKKGVTIEEARETMKDVSYFGTMMVHKGLADGMVSGAAHTTAHTIKPSFQIIKTAPGASVVSSVFLMVMQDRLWAFGDCAVNPNPTAEQIGEIAAVSAQTAAQFGIDPKVAILSYSTGTSGSGPDVDRAVEATAKAKELAPDVAIDGPLQFDAACDPGVGKKKAPDSPVAGQANVFIFPDLEAGNAGYKIAQRTGGALAVGPVLQGLNKPVNDLSRGATVPDIVNTVAITAIQAGAK